MLEAVHGKASRTGFLLWWRRRLSDGSAAADEAAARLMSTEGLQHIQREGLSSAAGCWPLSVLHSNGCSGRCAGSTRLVGPPEPSQQTYSVLDGVWTAGLASKYMWNTALQSKVRQNMRHKNLAVLKSHNNPPFSGQGI